jgi:hypothetical protein
MSSGHAGEWLVFTSHFYNIMLLTCRSVTSYERLLPAYLAIALFLAQGLIRAGYLLSKRRARRDTPIPPSTLAEPSGFLNKAKQQIKSQDALTLICNILNLLGTLTLVGLTVLALLTLKTDGQEHPNESDEWIGYNSIVQLGHICSATVFTQDTLVESVSVVLYVRVIIPRSMQCILLIVR